MFSFFVHSLFIFSSIATIMGLFGKYALVCEFVAHFGFVYLLLQGMCAILYVLFRKWKWVVLCFIIASVNLYQIYPLYIPQNKILDENVSRIKILFMNVYADNREYEKMSNYIKEVDPDILAVVELTEDWVNGVGEILDEFEYAKVAMREDAFGAGIFSDLNFSRAEIKEYVNAAMPSVEVDLRIDDKPLSLLVMHAHPPLSVDGFNLRNSHFENISKLRKKFLDNMVLVGDLNITSWSYYFRLLVSKMGLRDSREGFGLQKSWPVWIPKMGITIDHCLVSENVVVFNREVGKDIGSDHFPVIVEIGVV